MYIHTIGGHSTNRKKKKKKRFEQMFHSWKDIVHWNDRLRRNCCKLEDLGTLSGALPVHEGRFFYFLRQ